mmetsp:Transcript_10006/g.22376  ORF Transcript_10006/g.22376 Transcript_10006/m.22376 type:complete len:256 (-) Transcript_10006:430-1197(-)
MASMGTFSQQPAWYAEASAPLAPPGFLRAALDSFGEQCIDERLQDEPEGWSGEPGVSFRDVLGPPAHSAGMFVFQMSSPSVGPQETSQTERSKADGQPLRTRDIPVGFTGGMSVWRSLVGSSSHAAPVPQAQLFVVARPVAEPSASWPGITGQSASAAGPAPTRRNRRRGPLAVHAVKANSTVDILEHSLQDKCPICLSALLQGQRVCTLACQHRLHNKCSSQYFRSRHAQPRCPLCRLHFQRPAYSKPPALTGV